MASLKAFIASMGALATTVSNHMAASIASVAAHGISGFGSSGTATTVARADHAHTADAVGALATTSPAAAITGFSATAAALAATQAPGSATAVARGDHQHPFPTAANVDALPLSGGTLTGDLQMDGHRLLNAVIGWGIQHDIGNSNTYAIWLLGNGPRQTLTLNANCTLYIDYLNGSPPYGEYSLMIINPASYTIAWSNINRFLVAATVVRYLGDTMVTLYYWPSGRSSVRVERVLP